MFNINIYLICYADYILKKTPHSFFSFSEYTDHKHVL